MKTSPDPDPPAPTTPRDLGRVTLKQVAAEVGVHVTVASAVLNGANPRIRVSAETRRRIEAASEAMGYQPNAVAQSLVRRRTDTLGIVMPPREEGVPLIRGVFGLLLESVLEAVADRNLVSTVFWSKPGKEDGSLRRLHSGSCDGFLLFYQPPGNGVRETLFAAGEPVVLLSMTSDDPRAASVNVDDVDGGRRMTEYLLGLGHKRISVLWDGAPQRYATDRITGYRAALESSGVAVHPDWLVGGCGEWDPEGIAAQVADLMARPATERPTALFCVGGDSVAVACLGALRRQGVRVPEEVSVAGFNDQPVAALQYPPLTTMRLPYEGIARRAVEAVLERITAAPELRGGLPRNVLLPAELVVRGSTAPPPYEP